MTRSYRIRYIKEWWYDRMRMNLCPFSFSLPLVTVYCFHFSTESQRFANTYPFHTRMQPQLRRGAETLESDVSMAWRIQYWQYSERASTRLRPYQRMLSAFHSRDKQIRDSGVLWNVRCVYSMFGVSITCSLNPFVYLANEWRKWVNWEGWFL